MPLDLQDILQRLAALQASGGPNVGAPAMGGPSPDQMAAPMITGAQMPQAPTAPAPTPSLYERIMGGLFHVPTALQGQYSPSDIASARGQALIALGGHIASPGRSGVPFGVGLSEGLPMAQQAFQGYLGGMSQAATAAQNLQELQQKNAAMKTQQEGLAKAVAMFPNVPGQSKEDRWSAMGQAAMQLAVSGNAADAGSVAALIRAEQDHASTRDASLGIAPPEWYQKYTAANPPPATGGDLAMAKYQSRMAQAMMRDGFWKSATETRLQGQDSYKAGWNPVVEGGRNSRFDMGQTLQLARVYDRQIQPEIGMMQNKANFDAHYADAVAGNRQAYEPLIIAYASIADSKAQLRQGVIVMVQKYLDPSFKGSFQMAVSRLASGTLPPDVLAGMKQNIDAVMKERRSNVERWYKGTVKDRPEIEGYIQSPAEIFGDNDLAKKLGVQ